MEKEINITEILKDKPKGINLYSPIYGKVTFNTILSDGAIGVTTNGEAQYFFPNGKFTQQGECLLFPSKSMRSWKKFAWKKGDVLVSNDGKYEAIFDKFTDKEYKTFKGKYTILTNNDGSVDYLGDREFLSALRYTIEAKDAAQCYINTIEERLGGKLNMETLEIEPAKPKWTPKPFDKVLVRNEDRDNWCADFFSHIEDGDSFVCVSACWGQCIPYNEETAKLIGTTNDYEKD